MLQVNELKTHVDIFPTEESQLIRGKLMWKKINKSF